MLKPDQTIKDRCSNGKICKWNLEGDDSLTVLCTSSLPKEEFFVGKNRWKNLSFCGEKKVSVCECASGCFVAKSSLDDGISNNGAVISIAVSSM